MSPVGRMSGSLTRHFMLADIPRVIAGLPQPCTQAQAQAALDSLGAAHDALAARLFAYKGVQADVAPSATAIVIEDAMVRACRSQDPAATLLVWCALIMGDYRIADAVENFLTTAAGKLDSSHFDTSQLEHYLSEQGVSSPDKTASNILRWFETAGIVVPQRHGPTIIGIQKQLPTGLAARPLSELLTERLAIRGVRAAPPGNPIDIAVGIGANSWINLTADEFRRAATPIPASRALLARGEIPNELAELKRELYRKRQVILQGPPGTGKTYLARAFMSWFTAGLNADGRVGNILESLPSQERTPRRVAELATAQGTPGIWDIVQFHPSLTYDDFVRSLRAEPVPGGVTFVPTNRVFGFVCEVGRHLEEMGSATEVLFIVDEINRADLSKVMGELIYGLEYRDQAVTTPYTVDGNAGLMVPKNLYVIGTMNTADRSIALIDYALRRRFVYLDVSPSREIIEASGGFITEEGRHAALALFDGTAHLFQGSAELRSIQVGHSYYLPSGSASSLVDEADSLARQFAYEVIPLLLEYQVEGRFQPDGVDALLTGLGLATRSVDGGVDQVRLVSELGDRIIAGKYLPPPSPTT